MSLDDFKKSCLTCRVTGKKESHFRCPHCLGKGTWLDKEADPLRSIEIKCYQCGGDGGSPVGKIAWLVAGSDGGLKLSLEPYSRSASHIYLNVLKTGIIKEHTGRFHHME
ncbi:MAG: hypothetical protein JSU72_18070 [Deltaproteobacteria bacterium]|nr:MAG: hypothetical protein JSU72_18070 [Deltaproteobacteria bacterium]